MSGQILDKQGAIRKNVQSEQSDKEIEKMKEILTAVLLAAVVTLQRTSIAIVEDYPKDIFLIESTAYCYGEVTADGSEVRPGIAAAKKEWMGLTAVLYEVAPDGNVGEVIGIYEIKDTGSDYRIKNGTCIDIYIPDEEACVQYGRQQVYIQLMQP